MCGEDRCSDPEKPTIEIVSITGAANDLEDYYGDCGDCGGGYMSIVFSATYAELVRVEEGYLLAAGWVRGETGMWSHRDYDFGKQCVHEYAVNRQKKTDRDKAKI